MRCTPTGRTRGLPASPDNSKPSRSFQVSKLPLIISSVSWDVIAEGLKSTQAKTLTSSGIKVVFLSPAADALRQLRQGKCIVNGISMASSEEEFVRVAAECRHSTIILSGSPRVGQTVFSCSPQIISAGASGQPSSCWPCPGWGRDLDLA